MRKVIVVIAMAMAMCCLTGCKSQEEIAREDIFAHEYIIANGAVYSTDTITKIDYVSLTYQADMINLYLKNGTVVHTNEVGYTSTDHPEQYVRMP